MPQNKDYASMMPGGGMPAPAPAAGGMPGPEMGMGAAPMTSPTGGPMPQASASPFEMMAGGGSPTQMTQEGDRIKETIMQRLEEKGVFNVIVDDNQMQELMALVEDLVEAVMSEDKQRMAENPLTQVLAAESVDLEQAGQAAQMAVPGADLDAAEQQLSGGAAGPMMPPGPMMPEGM